MRVGLVGVGTANPEHVLEQAQAKQFAAGFFTATDDAPLDSFDNAGIDTRQIGRPIDWLAQPRSFVEKNAAYVEQALLVAETAALRALERAAIPPHEFGAIVFASSTGLATPSLDARLVQSLGLSRGIARVPLWGLGCGGGAAALARAAALAKGLGRPVLVIACEMCSLTFVHGDRRRANVIAVALFGDGAAACVVAPEPWWTAGRGPELLSGYSHLIDDSEDVMGWDLEDQGLRVRFASTIPGIVEARAVAWVREARKVAELDDDDPIVHLVMHPGGRKVIEAYESVLELQPHELRHARAVLREHGNMSSPTVLFVLERFWADTPASGAAGLLLGLGPGFCAEGLVFRW
jgi:alkylresorcinol/alkylpyrone synthase